MSFVRPEVSRALSRWSEVIAAFAVAAFGLWIVGIGGTFFVVIGAAIIGAALTLSVIAWRRMQFRLEVDAPGVVRVDEGRISYMGPITGGTVDLLELVEIEVIDVAGRRRCWRLRQADNQVLLVPLAASGAETLYDHFATLPGMDGRVLLAALGGDATTGRRIWSRKIAPEVIPPQ